MRITSFHFLALAMIATGCKAMESVGVGKAKEPTFTTVKVQRQDITGYAFFDGKVVIPASGQATILSPYAAPVANISTVAGKRVRQGDQLFKLTITGSEATVAAAKASARSADASLSAERSAVSEPVRAAKVTLAETIQAEKTAKEAIANGSMADIETATQARIDAERGLREAQQQVRDTLQPNVAAANDANSVYQAAKEDAAKGVLRSPISGTLVWLGVRQGESATDQQRLATVVNLNTVRIQGIVPPQLKDKVILKSKVIVALEGSNVAPLDGTVIDLGVMPPTKGQQSPGYLVIIRLVNSNAIVMPVTTVKRIGVKTGAASGVLVLPVSAVITKASKKFVSADLAGDGRWTDTPVTVGLTDGALIEIRTGLNEGTSVRVPNAQAP